MIRHDEAAAFRAAAEQGHTEIVGLFLRKSEIVQLKRFLLEAADCGAFQVAIFNRHSDVVDLLWETAGQFSDVQKRAISLRMNLRKNFGGKNGLIDASEALQPVWLHSSDELRQLIVLKQLVAHVTPEFHAANEEDLFSLKDYLISFEIPFLIRMDRITDVTARLCDVVSNYRDMVKALIKS